MIHHDIHGLRRQILTHTKLVECTAYTNSAVLTHVLLSLAKGGVYVFDKTTFHTTKEIITIERSVRNPVSKGEQREQSVMVYQYSTHTCSEIVKELSLILDIVPSKGYEHDVVAEHSENPSLLETDATHTKRVKAELPGGCARTTEASQLDVEEVADDAIYEECPRTPSSKQLVVPNVPEPKVTKTLFKESLVRDYVVENISRKTLSLVEGRRLLGGIISAQILKIISQKDFTFVDGKLVDIAFPNTPPFSELPSFCKVKQTDNDVSNQPRRDNQKPKVTMFETERAKLFDHRTPCKRRMDALWNS